MTNTSYLTKRMSVREINAVTRDGGTGRNVYLVAASGCKYRVTKARTRNGGMQVLTLTTGTWLCVIEADSFEVV